MCSEVTSKWAFGKYKVSLTNSVKRRAECGVRLAECDSVCVCAQRDEVSVNDG